METDNTVSIWIGNFDNISELDKFITINYDDEGEAEPAQFYKKYQIDIDDIDDYLVEKDVSERKFTNLYELLGGVSYETTIVTNLKSAGISDFIPESNAIILVYNYSYGGEVAEVDRTKFITSVDYR